jgi:hypothetical protein
MYWNVQINSRLEESHRLDNSLSSPFDGTSSGFEVDMAKDEKEMKWQRVAEEVRIIARRAPQGLTRDKLFERADQLEKSAELRRHLMCDPLFPFDENWIEKTRH